MAKPKDTFEQIFAEFGPLTSEEKETVHTKGVTFWIPDEYKKKYEAIQAKSKRRFSKMLKEVIMKSIDRIEVEAL